ncbi:hypothetical protein [Treponema vincentii]|uniref:hypothetical protein n=1 Tax=Treponema vincentii TaxID=69710 RepID=UPI001E648C0D|nr:hypothetical protein [Treponema vincentii]
MKNSGFKPTFSLADRALKALCLGDLLMRVLYRTRPYEQEKVRQMHSTAIMPTE